MSVELTDAKTFSDGSVIFEDTKFPPKYVFSKNVSGELKTFGCICELKNCFRKCCHFGFVFNVSSKECVKSSEDLIVNYGLNFSFVNAFQRNVGYKESGFGFVYGRPCEAVYLEDEGNLLLQEVNIVYPYFITANSVCQKKI